MALQLPIYLDNHATTRVDPRVVEVMLPYFTENYGNAGSTTHSFGHAARDALNHARESLAANIGAAPNELVFTSGSTESNNLAIFGVAHHKRARGKRILSVTTEHKAVIDPLSALKGEGFDIGLLPVAPHSTDRAGYLDPQRVADAIRDETCLVSVMLANNEIGVIQSIQEIAKICHDRGVLLHTDATQAVGKIPVNVVDLGVDLMSFTAHKIYGPRGIGALYVRRRDSIVRLHPLIYGGGQELGLRSGTHNVPGIVGFANALELCIEKMNDENARLKNLRDRLWQKISGSLEGVNLNGPALDDPNLRLTGNLNFTVAGVSGESLILGMPDIAISSGSACTSANPEPSHVLRALGLDEDAVRASLRFGIGRFNTIEEIDFAAEQVIENVRKLRNLAN